jgi:hypothetical protein
LRSQPLPSPRPSTADASALKTHLTTAPIAPRHPTVTPARPGTQVLSYCRRC